MNTVSFERGKRNSLKVCCKDVTVFDIEKEYLLKLCGSCGESEIKVKGEICDNCPCDCIDGKEFRNYGCIYFKFYLGCKEDNSINLPFGKYKLSLIDCEDGSIFYENYSLTVYPEQ